MLPLALKIVWFVLCFTGKWAVLLCWNANLENFSVPGTLACWVVVIAMAKSINIWWLPLIYGFTLTALEGIFCLGEWCARRGAISKELNMTRVVGMIYRMDPYLMPEGFRLGEPLAMPHLCMRC